MEKSNSRIDMLKQFIAEDPADDFSEYALALELEKTDERKEALYHLEKILSRNDGYLAAYYQCGRICEAEKNLKKAASFYVKGMEVAAKQKNNKTLNELRAALELLD